MIIVNATINPKENKKENIIQKAEALIKASRNSEGNISYMQIVKLIHYYLLKNGKLKNLYKNIWKQKNF